MTLEQNLSSHSPILGDVDESMLDDFKENIQTTIDACTHAQAILDACNDIQGVPFADIEDENNQLLGAYIESLHVIQEYIHLI